MRVTVCEGELTLQNLDAFEWFQPFLDAGEATLETAVSLRGGKRIALVARLNRDPIVVRGDDIVTKFLLLTHGHDGRTVLSLGFTPVRVVCNNTLRAAVRHRDSRLIRMRHTRAHKANLEVVRETMNTIDAEFEATADQYRRLAHKDTCQADVLRYIKLVFDVADKRETEISKAKRRILDDVLQCIEGGAGNDLTGARGTLWGAYNGVTEYLTHHRGADTARRFESAQCGAGAALSAKAFGAALDLARP